MRLECRLEVVLIQARALGDVIHRAAERGASVEGRLRALNDLDPLDVHQSQAREAPAAGHLDVLRGNIDVVDQKAYAVAALFRLQAAQGRRVVILRDRAVEGQAGHDLGDVLQVVETEILDLLSGNRGDRDRDIEKALLALARRDDDFFQDGLLGQCRGLDRAKRQKRQ